MALGAWRESEYNWTNTTKENMFNHKANCKHIYILCPRYYYHALIVL